MCRVSIKEPAGVLERMSFLFGGARPKAQDTFRDYHRKAASNARGMEREIARLNKDELSLQSELKKCGVEGRMDAATIKAKELIRLRSHRSRLQTMRSHMLGLSQQLQTMDTSTKMQDTLCGTAKMLQSVNARFDAASISRMLGDFERQNVLLKEKQEIVEECMESSLEVDGELDATSDAVLGVLQEAGLEIGSRLGPVGGSTGAEDFDARLQRLRAGMS